MPDRKIIALTPVRNEAYILPSFIEATLQIADVLIIADQNSNDETATIASDHRNVVLIRNSDDQYDEASRQKLLIATAREQFGEGNLLLAVDADELFYPLVADVDTVRSKLLAYPCGTTLLFDKPTLLGGIDNWKSYGAVFPLGYVDDGTAHESRYIHGRRVPEGSTAPIPFNDAAFVHLDRLDQSAHESKRCFYNCLERLSGQSTQLQRWRRGHFKYANTQTTGISKVDDHVQEWFGSLNISLESLKRAQPYWWDREVLKFFATHGCRRFWFESIWHRPWESILERVRSEGQDDLPPEIQRPPRFISFVRELMIFFYRKSLAVKNSSS